jgi:membrane protease subunit HflC
MKDNKLYIIIGGVLVALFTLMNSFFILDQRQSALIIQFGEPMRLLTDAGLKMKVPFIQDVLFFDKRIHNLDADTTEVIASDQKTMRVNAFTKYKIVDALKFYQRAKDEKGFKLRLSPILDSSLRQVLGSYPFKTLLTTDRAVIMVKIKNILNTEASDFGVEIVDVRILRADLPDKSRDAVYERMKSDREKEAKEIRAEGSEQAQKISATADKEKQVIIAEAKKKASILKGEGDSEAIRVFGNSFNKDPDFYEFYRSMQAYQKAINKDSTSMVISPDNEFLKYFKKSQ